MLDCIPDLDLRCCFAAAAFASISFEGIVVGAAMSVLLEVGFEVVAGVEDDINGISMCKQR